MIYLFTGQPGSGKTTLAEMLKNYLGNHMFHIDGDKMRKIFPNTDYTKEGRVRNIEKAFDIVRYLDTENHSVIISMVAPYRELREQLKKDCKVKEIYLYTTKERGRESFFATDYEEPLENFISICTDGSPRETFREIKKVLYL
jgi:adenylylsulfate kinase